jgi:hypothetical protein
LELSPFSFKSDEWMHTTAQTYSSWPKALSYKDLGKTRPPRFDVTPYDATTCNLTIM